MLTTKKIRAARTAAVAGLVMHLAGCAGATLGSGVGDAWLEEPPYYTGSRRTGAEGFAYLPIAYQAGASQAPVFDPGNGEGTEIGALLEAMNAHLESLARDRGSRVAPPPAGRAPDVQFGCNDFGFDECPPREEGDALGDGEPRMRLAVGRPSGEWAQGAAQALARAGADALLVLTLEVGQYRPRYTNWRGSKALDLGTGHTVSLPWLTSMDTPLQVLQLTGALVGPDGKAIRIGAEGLHARRTSLLVAGLGAQAILSDEDVATVRSARREDLPGQPLVWEAALRTLVDQLTGHR